MLSTAARVRGLHPLVHIDGVMFRLHYGPTVLLLLTFSILLTAKQFFGEPIECDVSQMPRSMANSYCWTEGTFSDNSKPSGTEGTAFPGVDAGRKTHEDHLLHTYYQWVYLMLFFQAILFYAPRWLWKAWESNRLESLADIRDSGKLARVICDDSFNVYFCRYVFCELLCFVNVVAQFFIVDRFLNGEFWNLGIQVLSSPPSGTQGGITRVFPRISECIIRKPGPSGDMQKHHTQCTMPLNIINEKIYIFLWFWFVFIFIVTLTTVTCRFLRFFAGSRLRARFMKHSYYQVPNAKGRVFSACTAGQCFILYMLRRTTDTTFLGELLHELGGSVKIKPTVLHA